MRFLKILVLFLLAITLVFLFFTFNLPDNIEIENSIIIDAPVETIYNYLIDLNNYPNWTNWKDYDSTIIYSISKISMGQNAEITWESEKHPTTHFKIIEANRYHRILFQLIWDNNLVYNEFIIKESNNNSLLTSKHNKELGSNPITKFFGSMMEREYLGEFDKIMTKIKNNIEKGS